MQRHKRWQSFLIIAVLFLTVYNVLPTVFFYTKPLKSAVSEPAAKKIMYNIAKRSNSLEKESLNWVSSYCQLLGIKPLSILLDESSAQTIRVNCKNAKEASLLKNHLDRAGMSIPFSPATLSIIETQDTDTTVLIQRKIPSHFDTKNLSSVFEFSFKKDQNGSPTPLYRALVEDRVLEMSLLIGGESSNAAYLQAFLSSSEEEVALNLCQNILAFERSFGDNPEIAHRFYRSFSQTFAAHPEELIERFIRKLQDKPQGAVKEALKILLEKKALLTEGAKPLDYASAAKLGSQIDGKTQAFLLTNYHPFVEKISIDWQNEKILLHLYSDVQEKLSLFDSSSSDVKSAANQFVFSAIAKLARDSDEVINPVSGMFCIDIPTLNNSQSFIAFSLASIAKTQLGQLQDTLSQVWTPSSIDLKSDVFPITDWETFSSWPKNKQNLALVLFAPCTSRTLPPQGFKTESLYIVAKGFNKMLDRYQKDSQSEESQTFLKDFNKLYTLLMKQGFVGYPGKSAPMGSQFASDYIFEAENYYQPVLGATRENFTVHGTKRYAVLEFSTAQERILAENKIDTSIHETILKMRDDYHASKLSLRGLQPLDAAPPTRSAFWSNCLLSAKKYFRGDDRKILNWGLDLSGGKTVQLELKDASNKVVDNPMDLKQGINELYSRVNKMGVSEVSIRQEGRFITLDFPGSQALSAAELVKASSMYFHVVNEKFSPTYRTLWPATHRFLQEVWDEAVISHRTNPEELNAIAWKHLYGGSSDAPTPVSQSARTVYEQGLRIANPLEDAQTSVFNDTLCKISVYRGKDSAEWFGQSHPLLIVFKNHALEGSSLDHVHASYDPSKGNFLTFGVKASQTTQGVKIAPQQDLSSWTSLFAKEKILGTNRETFSNGRGWRMAVILNGFVVSAPTLESALKDQASISGSFTQREVNQLESDLKAGSLSFSPTIISEKNVSPELGAQERINGISATLIALLLVIVVMIAYYRFGGFIASIAVIINLLILWAALVNIGATLTLASLAGLILTVGMAVDANVLVFERIREEFAETGSISEAVHAGYKKAFSAILDSNLTTIIAALILLNFDSGPIKGFALTLIIGIFSSMFTALFMTRFYFFEWVKNPKNQVLNMASWIKTSSVNFLKYAKPTVWISAVVIALGGVLLIKNSHTILGMDFRGGYALHIEMPVNEKGHYRETLEKAFLEAGVQPQEIQLRELSPNNQVKLFLSRGMDYKGRPFYGMPQAIHKDNISYGYESDPRLSWIVKSLVKNGITLEKATLEKLDTNWTLVSGQVSDSMRNSALLGLAAALFCILLYITFRFELHYALSATLCLAHDLVFTVAAIGILHAMKVPVHIDLNTIAALMTIVGYSLNDTIIVFDRIREDLKVFKRLSFSAVINQALNATLSRTLMTSGTTIIVLIPMIFLGGSTIFGFALVMVIGVFFGTLSSLFIAAPLMQYFALRGQKRKAALTEL